MLVIISDLHFTDETTANNVSGRAFTELLGPEMLRACKNGARELHLVLLGDIYDVVRTDHWVQQPASERPWNGNLEKATAMNPDPAVEHGFNAVLARTFEKTSFFSEMLQEVFENCGGLPTKITFVIGNHDRPLANFTSLQAAISGHFGHPVSFLSALDAPEYATLARHGHEWDDNCSPHALSNVMAPSRKRSRLDPASNKIANIGEVITAELMGGLIFYVAQKDPQLAVVLKDANHVRPLRDVFAWVEWRTRVFSTAQRKLVAESLRTAIDQVVDSELGKLWDRISPDLLCSGDITDYLKKIRLLAKGYRGLKNLSSVVIKVRDVLGIGDKDPVFEGAVKEFETLRAETRYLFYGHTHQARHNFVGGSRDQPKIYVNTGTYMPLIQAAFKGQGFVQAEQLTMAFVYRADEAGGAPAPRLDLWNGIRHSA
jgi:UDP-2,3-diacylglucosamine pyrophosphatase LpxH